MPKHLHIVCLDVPWPADYGGAIDMMNRIKAFKEKQVKIHLHYFTYNNRGTPNELNAFCESIHTYYRKKPIESLSINTPYFVSSRINQELIGNLNKDNHPVLLEGLHTTGILPYLNAERRVCVRMHNDEKIYYHQLAKCTSHPLKNYTIMQKVL